jgi:hypothetical protein
MFVVRCTSLDVSQPQVSRAAICSLRKITPSLDDRYKYVHVEGEEDRETVARRER